MDLKNLEDYFKTHHVSLFKKDIIDFKQVNINGENPFLFALRYNKIKNLGLDSSHFLFLIEKTNIDVLNNINYIKEYIDNKTNSSIHFSQNNINDFFKKFGASSSWEDVISLIKNNYKNSFYLTKEHFDTLIEKITEDLTPDKAALILIAYQKNKKEQNVEIDEMFINNIKNLIKTNFDNINTDFKNILLNDKIIDIEINKTNQEDNIKKTRNKII